MNQEQFTSLLRTALQVGGTVIATRLGIDGAAWESLSAAIVVIAATAWGLYARRKAAQIKAVADMPEVKTVVVEPALAASVKSPAVQAAPR